MCHASLASICFNLHHCIFQGQPDLVKKKSKRYRPRRRKTQPSVAQPDKTDNVTSASVIESSANGLKTALVASPRLAKQEQQPATMDPNQPQKSREEIMAERKAKKATKKCGKGEITTSSPATAPTAKAESPKPAKIVGPVTVNEQQAKDKPQVPIRTNKPAATEKPASADDKPEKSREEVLKERELKKLAKQQAKVGKGKGDTIQPSPLQKSETDGEITAKLSELHISEQPSASRPTEGTVAAKAKVATKAERRALQEAQRAMKAQAQQEQKPKPALTQKAQDKPAAATPKKVSVVSRGDGKIALDGSAVTSTKTSLPLHKVKLFNHLYTEKITFDAPINSEQIHPAIQRLGVQYAQGVIVGANSRCIAFLNAMKEMINDYVTPQQKEFSRGLEALIKPCVAFLKKCRPLSVSITNALRFIKYQLTQLNAEDSDDLVRCSVWYKKNLVAQLSYFCRKKKF